MKTIHLKSLPFPVWVVELPEGATNVRVKNSNIYYDILFAPAPFDLPFIPEKLLGKLSDLTEQQFEGLVNIYPIVKNNRRFYKNYGKQIICKERPWLDTARESFLSAVESEGYVFELPECNNEWCVNGYIDEGWGEYSRCIKCLDIENMEEKVIDLNRCYVFVSDIEAEYKRNVDAYAKERFKK